jgi:hypothetical protein
VRLDADDLTRHERRTTTLALAGVPLAAARAVPWVWETTAEPNLLGDIVLLVLFCLLFHGMDWARWVAATLAALGGVIALSTAMLWRTGGEPFSAIAVQTAVGISMLFSASILFGSAALDEPGRSHSRALRDLPWAQHVQRRSWSAPAVGAPLLLSRPRRGGQLAAWVCASLAIASWAIPASIGAGFLDAPTPLDPDAPALNNYYASLGNLVGIAIIVVSYAASLWFPLGAGLLVPLAIAWRHPARFLVLRPFNRAQLSGILGRVVRSEVAPLGHCYTLADAGIRTSRWLRAPLVLGQLTTMVFRHRTIANPRHLERLTWRMQVTWLRNMNWLASRRKIFPVACIHEAWRPCLMRLVSEVDAIVVDLTALGPSVRWELALLAHTGHVSRAVFLVHEDFEADVRRGLAELPFAAGFQLIVYGRRGLRDRGSLSKAVMDVLARSRPSWEAERQALEAFLARGEAPAALTRPSTSPSVGRSARIGIGLGVAAGAAAVALVAWTQPGLPEPEETVQVDPRLSKAAQHLADQAARLLTQPGSERVAAALAVESLARVPDARADSVLRTALSALSCRSDLAAPWREWTVALPGRARLASAKSGRWLAAEVGGAFFVLDTKLETATRLAGDVSANARLMDLAVSDDGERLATLTLEREPPATMSERAVGDTVRVRNKAGDVLWSRDSLGPLIGFGFVAGRLRVVTGTVGPEQGCSDASITGERWCGEIRDAESAALVASYRAHAAAWKAQLSSDGSVLAVTTRSALDVVQTSDGARVSRISSCFDGLSALSADHRKVACAISGLKGAGLEGAEIRLATVGSRGEPLSLTTTAPVLSLALDSDSAMLFATLGDGTLMAWDTGTRRSTARLSFAGARDVAYAPGQATAVVSSETGVKAIIVRPGDLIAKACTACDVAITPSEFLRHSGGEAGRTCAVKKSP